MRRAVVTGAAGFIGSHLVDHLLMGHWEVLGIDSFAPTYETASRRRTIDRLGRWGSFSFLEGDLATVDMGAIANQTDVVFHLAARPGVRSSWNDFGPSVEANVLETKSLLDALVSARRAPRLVFASSSSVYGQAPDYPTTEETPLRPISPYGVTKAAAEQLVGAYVSQFGLTATSLRYFTVYGPRQRPDMAFHKWIRAMVQERPVTLYGDGSAVRDFTYVEDVVRATVMAAEGPAGTYNVAGGSPVTVKEVISIMAISLGVEPAFDHWPEAKGDPPRTGGDISRISGELGWRPQVDLNEGIRAQVDSIRREALTPGG